MYPLHTFVTFTTDKIDHPIIKTDHHFTLVKCIVNSQFIKVFNQILERITLQHFMGWCQYDNLHFYILIYKIFIGFEKDHYWKKKGLPTSRTTD